MRAELRQRRLLALLDHHLRRLSPTRIMFDFKMAMPTTRRSRTGGTTNRTRGTSLSLSLVEFAPAPASMSMARAALSIPVAGVWAVTMLLWWSWGGVG